MSKMQGYSRKPDLSKTMHAFTLVELMVVIAIIAGLLMMALPNIRKQRARARSAQCQNNLRQYMVAMNQYMADHEGYFIYSGAGGSTKYEAESGVAMGQYKGGIKAGGGGMSSVSEGWLDDFVAPYIPEPALANSNNIQFLRSGQNSVRICPEINRNVFDPANSEFKGTTRTLTSYGEFEFADFEENYTAAGDLRLGTYFTTYGINNWSPVYRKQRAAITNNSVIAFIDWNADEGWGANIYTNPPTWKFTGHDRDGNPVVQGIPKAITNWWQTEVGFHHPGRSNDMAANYAAIDGSVSSISSNEISAANFR